MGFRRLVVVALLLAGLSEARAQMSPVADDQCTFPIRKWKMASASMYPTIPPDREFWAICMAHGLGESGVPADSLQLAVGSHDIRPGDIILVQLKELFGPRKNVTPRRVIGMPGDRIQLQGDVVQINGTLVDRHREADLILTRDQISEQLQQWRETLADGISYSIALTPRASMRKSETTDVVASHRNVCMSWATTGAIRLTRASRRSATLGSKTSLVS